ncbi:DUF4270 domain-containing protein [Bacteroides sp.]|uniref:DUF4270 domain-containing protein n=1 Tax=Bacteroides sp. TaxID=29523 RepID=UPI004025AB86
MKAKYALIALLAITFWGCDDNTAGLGLGMFPGSDQNINGKLSTFDVTTESVHAGEIYAMTNVGYVGKFTDETFGTYQAGFLAELNCPSGMTFPGVYDGTALDEKKKATRVMVDEAGLGDDVEPIYNSQNKLIGNIHTIELYLWYSSYFGDSLTACRLSVYELNKNLDTEHAYYTNIDPEEYYDHANPDNSLLGTKAYTAVDLSVKDSIRNLSTYVPSVHVSFRDEAAKEIGKEIIKKANELGVNLDNKEFRKIFKGIYVKSDYGDGTVLYINQAQMNVVYKCYAVDTITGLKLQKKVAEENGEYKDSTYYGYRTFATTREVIQANQLENDEVAIQKCIDNPDWTYLKSPAGIFTQITLPVSQIAEKLQGDTLNAVKLGIPIYNETSDKKFGMSTPNNVLLIRKKYKDSFFKGNQLSDGITSSLFTPTTTSFTQYTFNNITQMINDCLGDGEREKAEKSLPMTLEITNSSGEKVKQTVTTIEEWEKYSDWNKFILIPVLVTTDSSSSNSYYGSSSNVISIQHDLKPGYVRLKGGSKGSIQDAQGNPLHPEHLLKLEVVSTNFGTKSK